MTHKSGKRSSSDWSLSVLLTFSVPPVGWLHHFLFVECNNHWWLFNRQTFRSTRILDWRPKTDDRGPSSSLVLIDHLRPFTAASWSWVFCWGFSWFFRWRWWQSWSWSISLSCKPKLHPKPRFDLGLTWFRFVSRTLGLGTTQIACC